jgi:hypothetical protein
MQDMEVEEIQMIIKFWPGKTLRLHQFQVYDARSLLWRGDLCWISSGGGWTKGPIFMLFHCVPVDRLLAQMDRSFDTQELLPLLHSRGGKILTDRKEARVEKNWSPFVIGDVLYITYSIRPHVVMRCDWEPALDVLKCETVQEEATSPDVYESVAHIQADLRGSSTGLQLSLSDREFLSLGHVRIKEGGYQYFFYKFQGGSPPFQIVAFSPLFTLPHTKGSEFQYAHGICIEPDGVTITFGVNDDASWYVTVPLRHFYTMLATKHDASKSNWGKKLFELSHPVEMPSDLFGRSLKMNIDSMSKSLESSDFASNVLAFLRSIPNVTLEDCFARLSHQRQLFLRTSHALEERERTCQKKSAGMVDSECVDSGLLLSHTFDAFRAYNHILSRANMIIQDVFDRIYVRAQVSFKMPSVKPAGKTSASAMSYVQARQLALSGKISLAVVEAMRQEQVQAEAARSASLLEVKIMLAVSLLRLGNSSPNLSSYASLNKECEEVLISALALHPGHTTVLTLENLRASQSNFSMRINSGYSAL